MPAQRSNKEGGFWISDELANWHYQLLYFYCGFRQTLLAVIYFNLANILAKLFHCSITQLTLISERLMMSYYFKAKTKTQYRRSKKNETQITLLYMIFLQTTSINKKKWLLGLKLFWLLMMHFKINILLIRTIKERLGEAYISFKKEFLIPFCKTCHIMPIIQLYSSENCKLSPLLRVNLRSKLLYSICKKRNCKFLANYLVFLRLRRATCVILARSLLTDKSS